MPDGLKWPPALVASTALQSPFSWMWIACVLLGAKPPTSPVRCTPSPIGTTLSLPLTRLAEAEARFTVAALAVDTAAGGAGGAGGAFGAELQAATASTTAVASKVHVQRSRGRPIEQLVARG